MRIYLYTVLIFTVLFVANSIIAQNWSFTNVIGGEATENLTVVQTNAQGAAIWGGSFGNAISVGGFSLESFGAEDVIIGNTDANGNVLWAVNGGSSLDDELSAMVTDSEGEIYAAGTFWQEGNFGDTLIESIANPKAIFLTHYTSEGNLKWAQSISGGALKEVSHMALDDIGNLYLTGFFSDELFIQDTSLIAEGDTDLFLLKFNSSGNLIWAMRNGGQGDTRAEVIITDSNSDIYISGHFNDTTFVADTMLTANTFDEDLFLAKYDGNGQALWAKKAGGVFDDLPAAMAVDEEDNIYIGGFLIGVMRLSDDISIESSNGFGDAFLIKYSSAGQALLGRAFGGALFDEITGVLWSENTLSICGNFQQSLQIDGISLQAPNSTIGLFSGIFSETAQAQWLKSGTSNGAVFASDISVIPENGVYLIGNFSNNAVFGDNELISTGSFDGFLAKLSAEVSSTDQESIKEQPVIFPNPTNGLVLIQNIEEPYEVKVVDSSGKVIQKAKNLKQLNMRRQKPGYYQLFVYLKDGSFIAHPILVQ